MPIIEIISLRLNLDKEADQKLWDVLQKRAEGGKRNEFLKQTLLECLVEGAAAGKPAVRLSQRRIKTSVPTPVEPRLPDPVELAAAAGSSAPGSSPAPVPVTEGPSAVEQSVPQESDSEAAGLVSQFAM